MPETQLYFHTSCEEAFWQPAVSGTADALALQTPFLNWSHLRKDELLYKARGATSAVGPDPQLLQIYVA